MSRRESLLFQYSNSFPKVRACIYNSLRIKSQILIAYSRKTNTCDYFYIPFKATFVNHFLSSNVNIFCQIFSFSVFDTFLGFVAKTFIKFTSLNCKKLDEENNLTENMFFKVSTIIHYLVDIYIFVNRTNLHISLSWFWRKTELDMFQDILQK